MTVPPRGPAPGRPPMARPLLGGRPFPPFGPGFSPANMGIPMRMPLQDQQDGQSPAQLQSNQSQPNQAEKLKKVLFFKFEDQIVCLNFFLTLINFIACWLPA